MNSCDISRFIRNAARAQPRKVALRCEDRSITYGQLDSLIELYQRRILTAAAGRRRGVAAVIAYKSIEAVAFCQAALRCGWAYTVIDPRYPERRAAAMLADCDAAVILTDQDPAAVRRMASRAAILQVPGGEDDTIPPVASPGDRTPDPSLAAAPVDGDTTAFILYTSGSTGGPKGVPISHRNADYSIAWAQAALGFGADETFLNQAHLGVDFCVLDLYNAWNVAATVVMVPEYSAIFPSHVVQVIREEGVTNVWLVPSNIIALIDHGLMEVDSSQLRRFLYGGEAFPIAQLRRLRPWIGAVPVYNLYGPAEANFVTAHRLTAADFDAADVPIGKAIAGTSLKVRRESGELGDSGRGEICVCSPSVFRGYTHSAFDAQKFVDAAGATWYRTGDMGDLEEDGTLWYRGRIDHMVKVRGYRIELPEIEAKLLGHPAILQAAAVAVSTPDGHGKEIHAFCVRSRPVSLQEIRQFVAEALPAFMIPRDIHFVERIPMNQRGKLDRAALAQQVGA